MSQALLDSLQALTREHPVARKLLVSPTLNWGRELLRALARREGAWVGWEPMSLRAVADELSLVRLATARIRPASDVMLAALVGSAMDAARSRRELSGALRDMAHGPGMRRAVTDAVLELRMGGVTSAELRERGRGATADSLAAILAHFAGELDSQRLADPALVFDAALKEFDAEAPLVLPAVAALAPGLTVRGLPGQLLDRLRARGAVELAPGAPSPAAPGYDCFVAATPSDEVREALRRAAAEGWPDDEVELVTTDPDTHGVALDALCRATGLRATMLQGVPLRRTRIGRALERWLAWLEEGLPADRIREALEAGDYSPPPGGLTAGELAHELRRLQIGWGRPRWLAAVDTVTAPEWLERDVRRQRGEDERIDPELARLKGRDRAAALRTLLEEVIGLAPEVPDRGTGTEVRTTAARLARGALAWLDRVPIGEPGEQRTRERLQQRLQQLADIPGAETGFATALATLRQALDDLRAWTGSSPEHQPWSSAGGHVHLTDLAHAGTTGRRRLFLLGMDADRVAAGRTQDPLLPDALRREVGPGRLALSEDRRLEREALLARVLAGTAGRATLSWALAGDRSGRRAGPAAVVLDALRLSTAVPDLSYEQLRALAGPAACAVPEDGRTPLDGRDAWLDALADGPLLLDGTAAVREVWPQLAGSEPRPWAVLDGDAVTLAGDGAPPVSATSLELLSKCPLAWFYRYLLRVTPPADPEYDPDRWLDKGQRGLLLHELFEAAGQRFQDRQKSLDAATVRAEMLELAEEVLIRWRSLVPAPSEAVFETERAELQQCALAFLELERHASAERHAATWLHFEHDLRGPRAVFPLPDGREIRLTGRVDRVDRRPDGRLRVVDYKTGRPDRYRSPARAAPLDGGRLLQPALYAAAIAALHSGVATDFEYRFPTPAGRGERIPHDAAMLQQAVPVVEGLLEHLALGHYVPTTEPRDCGYCDFQEVCRVRQDRYGRVESSPRAELAGQQQEHDAAYAPMRRRRTPEEG